MNIAQAYADAVRPKSANETITTVTEKEVAEKQLSEALARDLHNQWLKQQKTIDLIQYLKQNEAACLDRARDLCAANTGSSNQINFLLLSAKTLNDILKYVTTGQHSK